MLANLKPDHYYPDIFAIDVDLLSREGIRGLICDIDNTIVPWSAEDVIQEVIDWFAKLEDDGFKLCLVSNGNDKRVKQFSQRLGIPGVGQAVKPARRAFRLARSRLSLNSDQIAVIGDQLFTDVLGGNRMGFKTILVDPMSRQEFFTTRIMRFFEGLFYKRGE
jgi:uncharacterized protein